MPRAKNAVASRAKTKKILSQTKGQYGRRKSVRSNAKNSLEKGLLHAYVGRKLKKREYRSVWIVRINAAIRDFDMSYSEFIGKLHKNNILINRKVLADLAMKSIISS